MEYTLLPANLEHLKTVLTWVSTPEQLWFWGGPSLTFPPRADKLWQQIDANDRNTFVLTDPDGNMVGFGQTLLREPDTIHLGRIIVSPALRGKGLGRILVEKLIEAGIANHHPARFTLNVYESNQPAVKLYQSLGFEVLEVFQEHGSLKMRLMVD